MAEVQIERKKIKVPTIDDPERLVYQITYTRGMLPPRFVFLPVKDWTPELEKEKIKEDIARAEAQEREILDI